MASTLFQFCSSSYSVCSIFVYLLSLWFIAWIINRCAMIKVNKSKTPPPPEAGGAWPIIGHLHLFRRSALPHKVLGEMADKYGPIFTMRMGMRKALVVSSSEMARECFHFNDIAISSRPKLIAIETMMYGGANFAFVPYGSFWRSIRKIVTLELLSNRRIDMMSYVWKEEINASMNKLYQTWLESKKSGSDVVIVDMKKCIVEMLVRNGLRTIFGKKCGCEEELLQLHELTRDYIDTAGKFMTADAFPFLRRFGLGAPRKAMRNLAKEMDSFVQGWLQEHKLKKLSGNTMSGRDFMDVMLSVLDESVGINGSGYGIDTINKATCLNLLAANMDTSSVLLTWVISLLLNNPHVMRRVKDELEIHVSKDRKVDESDIPNLVYLQAVVKETLRMYPTGPLGGPREFTEDCTVAGYHVKKGTRLIVNLSKIQNDPQVWEDPTEFRPERFLTTHKDVDIRGQNYEYFPFGAGRRMCPAVSFALRSAHLNLASFLHAFELSKPSGASIDMTECSGMTNLKDTPLHVLIAPRLSADLYQL